MVEKKTGGAEPHQFTEDTVPCLVQDLSGLPPHQAVAVFYETVGQAFPIKLLGPADAPLRYRDAAYILGDMMLCTTDLGAAEVNRSRAFAARSGIDSYVLSFLIHGKSEVPSSGASTQAGDLLVMDLAQPLRVIGTECNTFSISISRHLLAPVLKTSDEHNMRIFSSKNPLVALLRSYLWDLYARMSDMNLVQAQVTVAPTMQLIAAALNGAVTEEAVGSAGKRKPSKSGTTSMPICSIPTLPSNPSPPPSACRCGNSIICSSPMAASSPMCTGSACNAPVL